MMRGQFINKDDFQASFSFNESALFTTFSKFSPGGNREGELPDPIPNSEVKPLFADGTPLKSVGE